MSDIIKQESYLSKEEEVFWKDLLSKISKWEIEATSDLEIEKKKSELIKFSIEEIPNIEKEIKRFSQVEKSTQYQRLAFTRSFDDTSKRLMTAEKGYAELQADIKKKLLPLKLQEEKIKADQMKRLTALNDYKTRCQLDFNKQQSDAAVKIQKKITEVYAMALDCEEDVLEACLNSFVVQDFDCIYPEIHADKEFEAIAEGIYANWSSDSLFKDFQSDLISQFQNLEADKADKKAALEAREVVETNTFYIAEEKREVDDSFSHSPIYAPVAAKTKALKKKMVLDMPHTQDSVFKILKAYSSVFLVAQDYYTGKDYYDVVEKIATVIENMKNKGAADFEMLKFKEEIIL